MQTGRKTSLPSVASQSAGTPADRPDPLLTQPTTARSGEPLTLGLSDPRATDARLAGAKAANLAVATSAGLPVVPGFVVTTAAFDPAAPGWPGAPLPEALTQVLRAAWAEVGGDGAPLVVRSSSTVEDVGASSMAGQFQSCLDVVGWDAFESAVREVLGSSAAACRGRGRRRRWPSWCSGRWPPASEACCSGSTRSPGTAPTSSSRPSRGARSPS